MNLLFSQNNVVAAAKDEVLKSNTIVSPSKKRVSKLVGKKEKLSPKPKADQFSTAKPTEDSKPTKTNKKVKQMRNPILVLLIVLLVHFIAEHYVSWWSQKETNQSQ